MLEKLGKRLCSNLNSQRVHDYESETIGAQRIRGHRACLMEEEGKITSLVRDQWQRQNSLELSICTIYGEPR